MQELKRFKQFKEYKLNWEKINNSKIKQNINGDIVEVPFSEFDRIIYSGKGRIRPDRSLSATSFFIDSERYYFFSDNDVLNAILRLVYDSVLNGIDLNKCRIYYYEFTHFNTSGFYNFFLYSPEGLLWFSVPSLLEIAVFEYLLSDEVSDLESINRIDLVKAGFAYREFYNQSEDLRAKKISSLYGPVELDLLVHSNDYYRDYALKRIFDQQRNIFRLLLLLLGLTLLFFVFVLFAAKT